MFGTTKRLATAASRVGLAACVLLALTACKKDEASAGSAPKGGEASGGEPSAHGLCRRAKACECDDLEGVSVEACADRLVTDMLKGNDLPAEVWQCLVAMSCDDVCADRSPAAAACLQQGGGAAASEVEASRHRATMGIIKNMGATCPPGQRMVDGTCQ